MRILVTGCHGFVGHNVCKALLAKGHKVTGTDRLKNAISDKGDRVREIAGLGLKYIEADLANANSIDRILGRERVEVVFHLAAQFPIKHSRVAMDRYLSSNVIALGNVLESARAYGVKRVIYSSSIAARTGGRPSNLYGPSKRFGEEMCHVFSRMGVETVCLRMAAIYGPMMRVDAGIWQIANLILKRQPIPMMTGFRSKHEMLFIDDLAACMAAFADAKLAEPYFLETICAEEAKADFGDVAQIFGRLAGIEPSLPRDFAITPRGNPCDLSPIRKAIGFAPEVTLEQGLGRLLESMR